MQDIVKLAVFYSDTNSRRVNYTPGQGDQKVEVDTPMPLMFPVRVVEWLLATPRTPWEMHRKISELLTDSELAQTPAKLEMSLNWCIKECQLNMRDPGYNTLAPIPVITVDIITI